MQKTLDDLILGMRDKIREADKNTEVIGDLAKGVLVQNMVMDVLKDVVQRNTQLSETLRSQFSRPISFSERVQLEPHTPEDNWVGPKVLYRAVA